MNQGQVMDKIMLRLTVVDDYPPVASEGVWAELQPDGLYRIANFPFYSQDVCYDDEVAVQVEADGLKWFRQVGRSSGNSTLRVVFFKAGRERIAEVLERIDALGCRWEGMSQAFFAVNVPASVSLDSVLEYLQACFDQDWLDYESGLLRQ
ncbi:DUF4265 domain-containing protein [Pseudomonas sp. Au-Pse12]|uniref:DUF4265 domain-containing protein n=1 Tax=Pseudomonas sp. Au-Pse12 TaxID=2906459 RepID=UPI001E53E292|nr:DUF4265 domain-containing protein [Pseudomonas sp. Au-Pse12]MCE4056900.1 DUF4265 domain-containing protein [Pseudomonas sp. Au-Pse12]